MDLSLFDWNNDVNILSCMRLLYMEFVLEKKTNYDCGGPASNDDEHTDEFALVLTTRCEIIFKMIKLKSF